MLMRTTLAVAAIGLLSGCAADTAGITTSAVDPKTGVAAASAKIDPACVTLMSQIDSLRKEGVADRMEKAATSGKSASVTVKRNSLAKMTELDKANTEFQAKCSTISPKPAAAQAAAAPVSNTATAAAPNVAGSTAAKAPNTAVSAAANKTASAAPVVPKAP